MARLIRICLAATVFFVVSGGISEAETTYPNHAIKVMIPFPTGTQIDISTRIIAEKMASLLGQPFVVENKEGAQAQLACRDVVRAAPDGYTLGALPDGPTATIPAAWAALGQKEKSLCNHTDLKPIGFLTDIPIVLAVRSDVPVATLSELIAYLKAKPRSLNFAGAHPSGKLGIALLKTMGAEVVLIPYGGDPRAWTDILSGNVHGTFSTAFFALPHITSKRARALAVVAAVRSPLLPDVPTVREAGYPEFARFPTWGGLWAPKDVPAAIVKKLNDALNTALKDPTTVGKIRAMGLTPLPSKPEELGAQVARQTAEMTEFIRENKLKLVGD